MFAQVTRRASSSASVGSLEFPEVPLDGLHLYQRQVAALRGSGSFSSSSLIVRMGTATDGSS